MTEPLVAPDPPLETAGIRLRMLEDRDVPAFTRALEDDAIQEFAYSGHFPPDTAQVRAYVEQFRHNAAAGQSILLSFAGRDDEMLGLGMLFSVNRHHRDGEIGFWVGPWARGAGVATHGVRLLTGWAIHHVGLERVYATTAPDNAGALAVLGRAGFVRDGVVRGASRQASGERRDMVLLSMLYTDEQAPPDPRDR